MTSYQLNLITNLHLKTLARTLWCLIALMAAAPHICADEERNQTSKCRPVMLLHGLYENSKFTEPIATRIKKDCPGTDIFNSNAYPVLEALVPAWNQINGSLGREFLEFCRKHPEGITLIGHSHGALLARALCETYPNHTVHTFISIAGPQRGLFGLTTTYAPLIPLFQIPPFLDIMSQYYYLPESQNTFSFANYWNDPHQPETYLQQNIFLPVINNEMPTNRSESFKMGFTKLKKHITIGGPDDADIIPWQSSQYSYFDDKYPEVVDYKDNEIYKQDLFGLRTLDEDGRWVRYVKNDTNHFQFLTDETVYKDAILPYLKSIEEIEPAVSNETVVSDKPSMQNQNGVTNETLDASQNGTLITDKPSTSSQNGVTNQTLDASQNKTTAPDKPSTLSRNRATPKLQMEVKTKLGHHTSNATHKIKAQKHFVRN